MVKITQFLIENLKNEKLIFPKLARKEFSSYNQSVQQTFNSVFDNTNLKTELKQFLAAQIEEFKIENDVNLILNIVLIGSNLSSIKYANLKQKLGSKLGVEVVIHSFSGKESDIHHQIKSLINQIKQSFEGAENVHHGLIFQLPLEDKFLSYLNQIPVFSDVDLLSENWPYLLDQLVLWPTVQAIQLCLYEMINNDLGNEYPQKSINFNRSNINLKGKTVAVIGQGKLVGYPTLNWLAKTEATIISINKDTKNPELLTSQADILISGTGIPNLINSKWVKDGSILIDAGTSDVEGSLEGDIDSNNLPPNCILCPSPGGIGPITVLCLFWNLLETAKLRLVNKSLGK